MTAAVSLLGTLVAKDACAECDPKDSAMCASPIRRGEPSPYDGQVLTMPLAAELGVLADSCETRIALETARTSSIAALELRTQDRLFEIDLARLVDERRTLENDRDFWRAEATKEPPFFLQPGFLVPMSVALGVTVGVVLAH